MSIIPEALHNKGYCIVADNYYTCLPLVLTLLNFGFHYVGTLRSNRKGITLDLPKSAQVTRPVPLTTPDPLLQSSISEVLFEFSSPCSGCTVLCGETGRTSESSQHCRPPWVSASARSVQPQKRHSTRKKSLRYRLLLPQITVDVTNGDTPHTANDDRSVQSLHGWSRPGWPDSNAVYACDPFETSDPQSVHSIAADDGCERSHSLRAVSWLGLQQGIIVSYPDH
jgi:hypothetical protein